MPRPANRCIFPCCLSFLQLALTTKPQNTLEAPVHVGLVITTTIRDNLGILKVLLNYKEIFKSFYSHRMEYLGH